MEPTLSPAWRPEIRWCVTTEQEVSLQGSHGNHQYIWRITSPLNAKGNTTECMLVAILVHSCGQRDFPRLSIESSQTSHSDLNVVYTRHPVKLPNPCGFDAVLVNDYIDWPFILLRMLYFQLDALVLLLCSWGLRSWFFMKCHRSRVICGNSN